MLSTEHMHNAKCIVSVHALMWMMLYVELYVIPSRICNSATDKCTQKQASRAKMDYRLLCIACEHMNGKNSELFFCYYKEGKNLKKIPNSNRENENVTYLFKRKNDYSSSFYDGLEKMNSSSLLLFLQHFYYFYALLVWQWTFHCNLTC